jgi:SAM-dependent methyltransferase
MLIRWFKKIILSKNKFLKCGLKFFLLLNNFSYRQAGIWAVKYYNIHPKHLFNSYHKFFLDNIADGVIVLDIGCGRGELTVDVAKKASKVIAYDTNKEAIKYAKRSNCRDNIYYFIGDATKDIPQERFDVIISSNVLEHLKNPVEHLKALSKISDKLLIRVPNLDRGWLVYVKKDLGIDYFLDPQHYREYTKSSLADELKRGGWEIEAIDYVGNELRVVAHTINKKR